MYWCVCVAAVITQDFCGGEVAGQKDRAAAQLCAYVCNRDGAMGLMGRGRRVAKKKGETAAPFVVRANELDFSRLSPLPLLLLSPKTELSHVRTKMCFHISVFEIFSPLYFIFFYIVCMALRPHNRETHMSGIRNQNKRTESRRNRTKTFYFD